MSRSVKPKAAKAHYLKGTDDHSPEILSTIYKGYNEPGKSESPSEGMYSLKLTAYKDAGKSKNQ